MNEYKKNRFGGDKRGGGFGNRNFSRGSFGGAGGFGRDRNTTGRGTELFKTTCASCGNTCEVPFKPNGKKPVYCKACFVQNDGGLERPAGNFDRFAPRREFSPKPSFNAPEHAPQTKGIQDLVVQVGAMNAKLDRLIELLARPAQAPKPTQAEEVSSPKVEEAVSKPVKKSSAKAKSAKK